MSTVNSVTNSIDLKNTGRTTGLMLRAISQALLSPDEWIAFRDHDSLATRWNHKYVDSLRDKVSKLGLTVDVDVRSGVVMVRSPISRMRAMARKGKMRTASGVKV